MNYRTIAPGDGDRAHGTRHGYSKLKCRCDDCKKANSEWWKAYKQRSGYVRIKMQMPAHTEAKHGSATMYTYGCRCDACKQAIKDRYREKRETGWRQGTRRSREQYMLDRYGELQHGTARMYRRYGCRCGACTFAYSAHVCSLRSYTNGRNNWY